MSNDHHRGIGAEKCSQAHGISREAQDKHATESYERAALAWDKVRAFAACSPALSIRFVVGIPSNMSTGFDRSVIG